MKFHLEEWLKAQGRKRSQHLTKDTPAGPRPVPRINKDEILAAVERLQPVSLSRLAAELGYQYTTMRNRLIELAPYLDGYIDGNKRLWKLGTGNIEFREMRGFDKLTVKNMLLVIAGRPIWFVEDICEAVGYSRTVVNRKLHAMRDAGYIKSELTGCEGGRLKWSITKEGLKEIEQVK